MKRVKMHLFAGAALLLLVSATRGAELEFKEFKSDKGRFSIDLPREPKTSVKDVGDGIKENTFFSPVSKDLMFTVKYLDFPQKLVTGKDPQERMKTFRRGYRKGKEILDDEVISHKATKVPGRDYRLEAEPGFYVRERMYWDAGRLYIMYIGSEDKDDLTSDDAKRFFDSFKIVRPEGKK